VSDFIAISDDKTKGLPYGGYDFAKPSLAVVASADGRGVVLWHVGGHIAVEFDGGTMAAEDIGLDPPDGGIWIWEGKLEGGSGPTWYNPDGDQASLDGKFRPLTDEEWLAIRAGESPWDDREWQLCFCDREGVPCLKHEADPPVAKPCPRCSECVGAEHHWLEHAEHPDQSDDETTITEEFAGFICKHCEVKADLCEECDGPIFPRTGATSCADCTAGRGDIDP